MLLAKNAVNNIIEPFGFDHFFNILNHVSFVAQKGS